MSSFLASHPFLIVLGLIALGFVIGFVIPKPRSIGFLQPSSVTLAFIAILTIVLSKLDLLWPETTLLLTGLVLYLSVHLLVRIALSLIDDSFKHTYDAVDDRPVAPSNSHDKGGRYRNPFTKVGTTRTL